MICGLGHIMFQYGGRDWRWDVKIINVLSAYTWHKGLEDSSFKKDCWSDI